MNWFSTALLSAFLINAAAAPAANSQSKATGMSPAEKWVVKQIVAGEVADLSKQFPTEADRKLGARFLENVLTGKLQGVKPHHNGVRISGAIIQESIDLRNAHVVYEVELDQCRFINPANFAGASFDGAISFFQTTFESNVDFYAIKVRGDAFFQGAIFEKEARFGSANIAGDFIAAEARFNHPNFNSMRVGLAAFFYDAIFERPVYFVHIDIAGRFEASRAKFKMAAYFGSMKVGGDVIFEEALFEGPVDFESANIGKSFEANLSQFRNKNHPASFSSMKIGEDALFRNALFEGPADFSRVDIAGSFEAEGTKFCNAEMEVNFNSIKVGDSVSVEDAIFEGPVDFRWGHFARNFEAEKAQFKNKQSVATFNSMKIGHTAFFDNAFFEGPVDFVKVEIGGNFQAMGAHFNYEAANSNKVDNAGNSPTSEGSSDTEAKEVSFNSMKVLGSTSFQDAKFKGPLNLRYADFEHLNVSNVSWPQKAGSVDMTGMTYKYIGAVKNNEPESHELILKLIEKSVFSADVYKNLEAFFLRQGYRAHADEAFIAGKRRERKEHLSGIPSFGSLVLDLLVGYGRHAWQIVIPCVLLVGFGVALFSPNKMEPQKIDATPRIYSRFWYSLGLFLPVVNLESDKVWKPKPEQTFLRNYMRVHILLGWILIPILLAALTGLIK